MSLFLKDSWISTLRNAIRTSLRDVGKGWFNIHEKNFQVYEISKLKKLMEMVKFIMQVRNFSLKFLWTLFSTSKFEAIMFFKVINNLLLKVSCLFSWMIFFTHRIPCGTWFRIPWSTSHRWCLMQAIQLWSCLKILHGELTSSAAPTSESHTLKNQLPMSYQNYRVVCSLYNFTETAMGSHG